MIRDLFPSATFTTNRTDKFSEQCMPVGIHFWMSTFNGINKSTFELSAKMINNFFYFHSCHYILLLAIQCS
jgi:hypothetical protein